MSQGSDGLNGFVTGSVMADNARFSLTENAEKVAEKTKDFFLRPSIL